MHVVCLCNFKLTLKFQQIVEMNYYSTSFQRSCKVIFFPICSEIQNLSSLLIKVFTSRTTPRLWFKIQDASQDFLKDVRLSEKYSHVSGLKSNYLCESWWKALLLFNNMSESRLHPKINTEVRHSLGNSFPHIFAFQIDHFFVHRPFGFTFQQSFLEGSYFFKNYYILLSCNM